MEGETLGKMMENGQTEIDEKHLSYVQRLREYYADPPGPMNDEDFKIEKIKDPKKWKLRSKKSELSTMIKIDEKLTKLNRVMELIYNEMEKEGFSKELKGNFDRAEREYESLENERKKLAKLKPSRKNKYNRKNKYTRKNKLSKKRKRKKTKKKKIKV